MEVHNEGVKEETFIQTDRKGREDVQQVGSWRTGQTRWWLADCVVPPLCADKLGRTTGEQDRLRNPEFQCGEIKP